MDIYLVGGAVRDRLLGLPVTEQDWVVTGASEVELRHLGYKSVGKDFPVFLHPDTGEEYALARVERKVGKGHTGFECSTDSVTLEDDLRRRDLTINAIAEDKAGRLIDPWGGLDDLDNRVLRHVSAAFEEDPLRVLRVARFAARFHALGFTIASETLALMRRMVQRGDLAELAPERIWLELEKALATDHPNVFIEVLDQLGAGALLWPEISRAAAARLAEFSSRSVDLRFRYAALLVDLTPETILELGNRLRGPGRFTDFARLAAALYQRWCAGAGPGPDAAVDLLYAADAFRQPLRFQDLNAFFRLVNDEPDVELTARYWHNCFDIASKVSAHDVDAGLRGSAIGDAIRAEQARQIGAYCG